MANGPSEDGRTVNLSLPVEVYAAACTFIGHSVCVLHGDNVGETEMLIGLLALPQGIGDEVLTAFSAAHINAEVLQAVCVERSEKKGEQEQQQEREERLAIKRQILVNIGGGMR